MDVLGITLVVTILVFLIIRELVMWYWKINKRLSSLYAGAKLTLTSEGVSHEDKAVAKFSKAMNAKIEQFKQKNYVLEQAIVKNIVYWFDKEEEKTYRVILPELTFRKERSNE
jgi:hypothetical protein